MGEIQVDRKKFLATVGAGALAAMTPEDKAEELEHYMIDVLEGHRIGAVQARQVVAEHLADNFDVLEIVCDVPESWRTGIVDPVSLVASNRSLETTEHKVEAPVAVNVTNLGNVLAVGVHHLARRI